MTDKLKETTCDLNYIEIYSDETDNVKRDIQLNCNLLFIPSKNIQTVQRVKNFDLSGLWADSYGDIIYFSSQFNAIKEFKITSLWLTVDESQTHSKSQYKLNMYLKMCVNGKTNDDYMGKITIIAESEFGMYEILQFFREGVAFSSNDSMIKALKLKFEFDYIFFKRDND